VIQAETNRLRQQVMNLKKQADAAEQTLAEERQKTEVDLLLFVLLDKSVTRRVVTPVEHMYVFTILLRGINLWL